MFEIQVGENVQSARFIVELGSTPILEYNPDHTPDYPEDPVRPLIDQLIDEVAFQLIQLTEVADLFNDSTLILNQKPVTLADDALRLNLWAYKRKYPVKDILRYLKPSKDDIRMFQCEGPIND